MDNNKCELCGKQIPNRREIIAFGKFIKKGYGISKVFEWHLYSYKGERYNIPLFDNEKIEHVHKIYCDICGRATHRPSCCGINLNDQRL